MNGPKKRKFGEMFHVKQLFEGKGVVVRQRVVNSGSFRPFPTLAFV